METKCVANLLRTLYLVILFIFNNIESKTLIITHCYNNPEFIEIQYQTFKAFVQDDYEFVVFSDAPTQEGHQHIADVCRQYDIPCIRVPQDIHEEPYYLPLNMPEIYADHIKPSNVRHVHSIQYSLDTLGFDNDGVVLLIDMDMFLVRPFNISEFMKDYDIASLFKGTNNDQGDNINYCWPGLTFLNMNSMPDKRLINFNCGWVNGCSGDSGGFTHYYLKDHLQLRIKGISDLYSGQICCSDRFYPNQNEHNAQLPDDIKIAQWKRQKFNDKEINFLLQNPDTIQYLMQGDDCWFLHYRGGSNYENLSPDYHQRKKDLVKSYLADIMESSFLRKILQWFKVM